MKRVRWSHFFASLAIGLWMVLLAGSSFAAEEAKAPEPAKAEAPAAAAAPRLPRQRRRRSCRRYFTATSRRSEEAACMAGSNRSSIRRLGDARR